MPREERGKRQREYKREYGEQQEERLKNRKREKREKKGGGDKRENGGTNREKLFCNIQWLDWIEFLFGFNENVIFVFE